MRRRGALCAVGLLLAACGGRTIALPPALEARPTPTLAPVSLPADDAPHDVLTEWWYYTGHLQAPAGRSYGFELVFFQSRRDALPAIYAAHFAVTDAAGQRFRYDQRFVTGSRAKVGPGYAISLGDWSLGGANGADGLRAAMNEYAIDLSLRSLKPAVLHNGSGIISFSAAGDSYYYSRTRSEVSGTLEDHGERLPVTGIAWMDHQWGNFIGTAEGGWDWFSVQLEDQTELMLFNLRSPEGSPAGGYASFIDARGEQTTLPAGSYATESLGQWTSPHTGITYPSGWRLRTTSPALELTLTPLLKDQELDTRGTTGVTYWEGASAVSGTAGGRPIAGKAYVELVGYGPKKGQ